jgi:hypothetical protein
VLTQKRSALEAWELAGADKTVMALTNVDVPLVPRPEQETAADNRIIHSASSRDISVGFVGGPIDGPCARDYEARAIETAHGVVVTVFGHARYSTPIACDLAGLSRTTVVTLDAPLGDRALFDGATGRHLPDSTYRPSLPALSPSPSTTATGAASCATTGYGATLTGDSLVAFGCGDGPQVVTLRRSTHFPRFSLLWVSEVLQLLTKTTSDEEAAGLHAAAPSEFGLATISQVGGSLTIDLPAGFDKRNGILSSSANAQLLYAALKATLLSAKAPFTTVRITIVGSCSAWATMMESDTCTLP